ncbi:MAG: hypothetical protein K6F37_00215 [Lachnospiraceae bacterium]|nr:hypothetical protein [Lachnospiraceae bacterium]
MLKIKAPIRSRISTPITTVGEGFANRIIGNYELFDLSVTGEDFLHLLTAPPEVFLLDEGSSVNMSSTVNVREINSKKIEIINNFLNRIALSDSVNLTYQDRVFITDVLHKLGITETASFMKRVENIKNEQRDFSEKLNAYWNHSEEMKALVEEYISSSESRKEENQSFDETNINNLHQSIFKRLQTGALYQVLSNFYQEEKGFSEITENEINISEQKETAEKLLLQALINEVRGEELPLIYRHDNYYENEAALPEETEEDAKRSITAAALLSVIRSATVSRREENFEYKNSWYSIAKSLYRSEENTFKRITENLHRNMTLIEEGITNAESFLNLDFQSINREELISDIDARKSELLNYVVETNDSEEFSVSQNTYENAFNASDITNIKGDEIAENTFVSERTDASLSRTENNLLRQQLTQNIEENNRQMRATYEAHLHALTRNYEASIPRKTRREIEEAQKEALKSPEVFMQKYREEGIKADERRKEYERKRGELVLTQSPDAFTLIQQFLEHPEIIPEGVQITKNDIGSLLYDSRQVENSYREVERQLKISDENIREYRRQENERRNLNNLTENRSNEVYQNETDRASIEHLRQDVLNQSEFTEREETLREAEHRKINNLEQFKTSFSETERQLRTSEENSLNQLIEENERHELNNLTESENREFYENEVSRATTEHLRENRLIQNEIRDSEENIRETEGFIKNTLERELAKARQVHTTERRASEKMERAVENLSLVHKTTETAIDEETLEALQRSRTTNTKTVEHHTVEEHHEKDERVISNIVDKKLIDQERRLEELIDEGMTRKMNSISDKVYRQIEKRLANERSRRGV